MTTMIRPDWFDDWVEQGVNGARLKKNAPKDIKKKFNKYKEEIDKGGIIFE